MLSNTVNAEDAQSKITVAEAAIILKRSERTIQNFAKAGKIKGTFIGGKYYLEHQSVIDFQEKLHYKVREKQPTGSNEKSAVKELDVPSLTCPNCLAVEYDHNFNVNCFSVLCKCCHLTYFVTREIKYYKTKEEYRECHGY